MMQERSDRTLWLALLLLIPCGALAFPALLADDPIPHATGTGWLLLSALPAALLLPFCLRSGIPRIALLFLPLLGIGLAKVLSGTAADTFELNRALLLSCVTFVALLGGSTFSQRASLLFQRGAILISFALTLQALASPGAGGPLGNSGVLSQAALPGAVLGALWFQSKNDFAHLLGLAAAVAFAIHAGSTPVLAGMLAFGVALLLAAVLAPRESRSGSAVLIVFALIAPVFLALPSTSTTEAASTAPSSNTGGAEVRLRIWAELPGLIGDHPLLGVGPGQFRAEFPPYRDPAEIELSTHGHHSEAGGEVEHAHSDWLQVFAEYGLVGGVCFAALLAALALAAVRMCRRSREEAGAHAALGPVALALIINSLLHAPLTFEPAPAMIAWVLLGALAGRGKSCGEGLRLGFWIGCVLAISLLAQTTRALALVRHGEHLAERSRAVELYAKELANEPIDPRALGSEFWLREGRILRDALEAAPDSPTALSLLAAHFGTSESSSSTRAQAQDAWTRALAHRPHQVSTLIGLGLLADDTETRRAYWQHALEIDPGHPIALANMARLESLEGSPERASELLNRLDAAGHLDDALLKDLGARALLAGRTSFGTSLLSRRIQEFDLTRPDDALALAQASRLADEPALYSDALEATAHRLWGVENLEAGEHRFALSKLRQALKLSRRYLSDGDVPTRLLLAATYGLSGEEERAREELEALDSKSIIAADWDELPSVARTALEALGVQAPARDGL